MCAPPSKRWKELAGTSAPRGLASFVLLPRRPCPRGWGRQVPGWPPSWHTTAELAAPYPVRRPSAFLSRSCLVRKLHSLNSGNPGKPPNGPPRTRLKTCLLRVPSISCSRMGSGQITLGLMSTAPDDRSPSFGPDSRLPVLFSLPQRRRLAVERAGPISRIAGERFI